MDTGNLEKLLVQNKGERQFSYFIPQEGEMQLTDPESGMSVHLTGIPHRGLAIKLPVSQPGYFKPPYSPICDYFVVVPRDGGADVVLCEMKTTLGDREHNHACAQIKCSIPLFWYIHKALTTHFGGDEKIRMHFAVFATKVANMPSVSTTHEGSRKQGGVIDARKIDGKKVRVIVNHGAISFSDLCAAGK